MARNGLFVFFVAAGLLTEAALFAAPADWEGHYEKGIGHAAEGRFSEARKEFTHALASDPYLVHISSCAQIAGDAAAGKISEAAGRAIFRGIEAGNKNKWDEAIVELDKAAGLEPAYAALFNERGIAFACSGRNDKAISDFTRAIALKPNYEYAYSNRAYSYAHSGYKGKALADFDEALKINPYYALGFYNRGVFYSEYLGLNEHAIGDFTRAIEANHRFEDAYIDRGVVYYKMGEYDNAIKDFDRALEISPENSRARQNKDACAEHSFRVYTRE